ESAKDLEKMDRHYTAKGFARNGRTHSRDNFHPRHFGQLLLQHRRRGKSKRTIRRVHYRRWHIRSRISARSVRPRQDDWLGGGQTTELPHPRPRRRAIHITRAFTGHPESGIASTEGYLGQRARTRS